MSSLCSRMLHIPTKSKPFLSHNIISKPAMVRLAVWKDGETTDPGHVLFHSEMITFNTLLQMIGLPTEVSQ